MCSLHFILSKFYSRCDPFYTDQGTLHANIQIIDASTLRVVLLTPNRNVIEDHNVSMSNSEVEQILQRLVEQKYVPCVGFDSNHQTYRNLLQRLRKSDIDGTLIEKYNGNIIFRSRSCQYTFVSNDENDIADQCQNCYDYIVELDSKYLGGAIFAKPIDPISIPKAETNVITQVEINDDDQGKRKRGRPKGSKNKNYYLDLVMSDNNSKVLNTSTDIDVKDELEHKQENDENDPSNIVDSERILVKTDDPDYIYGTEDIAMDDDPIDTDYNQLVKRGIRKRITTKRQKALLETKRKRGRPPIKVGPIDCPDCGKVFETAKDYRKHCLEHTNSFACSEGECVKRFKSQKELDIHLRKHRGEKPYVCSDCDKAYALRQDLRLHMRKHTGKHTMLCIFFLKFQEQTTYLKCI